VNKEVKEKKIIRCFPLYLSLIFLFNPNITIVDPLPDFIGYILLCIAIYRLADIGDGVGDAYNAFKKMILVDAGKWLAVLWVFGMTVPSERNSSLLLWTFVFAVLEMIFLLPAYKKLFEGLTQIGYLFPSRAIFGTNEKRSRTDRMRNLTFVFVIVKAVFTFLPELADLTNSAYDETTNISVNLYRYIGLMRGMAFIPVFIVGVIWLISMALYYRAVASDTSLTSALSEKYKTSVLPRRGLFIRRNFRTFFLIFSAALFLSADFRIDDINMIPDYLCAVVLIISIAFLKKYIDKGIVSTMILAVSHLCVSIAASILENNFFSEYYYSAIIKSDEVRSAYILMSSVNALKSILFLIVIYSVYRMLLRSIELHTGYVEGTGTWDSGEKKLIVSVHSDLKRELIYPMAALILYVASDICFDIFAPKVYFMGFINGICAIIFIALFIKALLSVQRGIDTKYMLE